MIALPLPKVVEMEPRPDRAKVRERVEVLTVREGTCTERWGSWAKRFTLSSEPKL